MKTQKDYTDEFREQIVKLKQGGKSNAELTRTYGVSRTSIANWVKMYGKSGSFREKDNESAIEKELKELRKENQRLKMEADLLNQCALIMARR